uniref:Uncharacterized protein n=1 Tax=Rhizophora mucronata TaxID=61149 RepID=A0A2P2PUT6_RHIMU
MLQISLFMWGIFRVCSSFLRILFMMNINFFHPNT